MCNLQKAHEKKYNIRVKLNKSEKSMEKGLEIFNLLLYNIYVTMTKENIVILFFSEIQRMV